MKTETPVTTEVVPIEETINYIPTEQPTFNAAATTVAIPHEETAYQQQAYLVYETTPPGAPKGGVWGKQRYRGRLTAAATVGGVLVAFLPGLIMLIFRLDERDAYLAKDGNLYDAKGKILGSSKELKFIPERPRARVQL